MTPKQILATVIGIVVTIVTTAIVTSTLTTYEAGTNALTKEQIKQVIVEEGVTIDQIEAAIKESMVADIDGETMTYGQALSRMHTRMTRFETNQQILIDAFEAMTE